MRAIKAAARARPSGFAADMISARRVTHEEVWTPSEQTLRMFVNSDAPLASSQADAQVAAEVRAIDDAPSLCAGFANTQSYRLTASFLCVEAWNCETYFDGHVCSGRDEAQCSVELRVNFETELCGAVP
jgi:hypothetical protein